MNIYGTAPRYQPYTYRPLSGDRAIRVLHLRPAALPGDPIQIELTEVCLDQNPTFQALSYVWDPDRNGVTREIFCENGTIQVTLNCEMALKQLRNRSYPRPSIARRAFSCMPWHSHALSASITAWWIDAICINQHDIPEKEGQLRLMGDLYSSAAEVVVWLGSNSYAERELNVLQSMAINYHKYNGDINRVLPLINSWPRDETASESQWLGNNPWFHRVWTLQELGLAQKNKAFFLLGSTRLAWDDLQDLVPVLQKNRHAFMLQLVGINQIRLVLRAQHPVIHFQHFLSTPRLPVSKAFTMIYINSVLERQCKEILDKVFALYSMAKRQGLSWPEPHYSASAGDVFSRASMLTIQHDNSLELLRYSGYAQPGPSWPSWVPQIETSIDLVFAGMPRFNASGDSSTPKYRFIPNSKQLVLYGKTLSQIRTATRSFPRDDHAEDQETNRAVWSEWLEFWKSWSVDFTPENDRLTLFNVLFQDKDRYKFVSTPRIFEIIWRSFHAWLDAEAGTGQVTMLLGEDGRWTAANERLMPRDSLLETLTDKCKNKQLFCTVDGHLGLAPRGVFDAISRTSAITVLVSGLKVPLVLQSEGREGNSYKLLGPAFVDRVMFGEEWDNHSRGELQEYTLI